MANSKSQYEFEIENDIERTFPNDPKFQKGKANYLVLQRILRAIAYYAPHVGYV